MIEHFCQQILTEKNLFHCNTFLNNAEKVYNRHLLLFFCLISRNLCAKFLDVCQSNFIHLSCQAQHFRIHLSCRTLNQLLLTKNTDRVQQRQAYKFGLVLVVVDSIEIGVRQYLYIEVKLFSADLDSIFVEVIGILSQKINSFRNFNFPFSQQVKAIHNIFLLVNELILLHLDDFQLLNKQLQLRVLERVENWHLTKQLDDLILLEIVKEQQALVKLVQTDIQQQSIRFSDYQGQTMLWFVASQRYEVQESLRLNHLQVLDIQVVAQSLSFKQLRFFERFMDIFLVGSDCMFDLIVFWLLSEVIYKLMQNLPQIWAFLICLLLEDDANLSLQKDSDSSDPFATRGDEISLLVQLRPALSQHILGNFRRQFVRQLPKEFVSTQKLIYMRVISCCPFFELPGQDLNDILWDLSLLFATVGWHYN